MNKANNVLFQTFFATFILLLLSSETNSQFIGNFGIKGGLNLSKLSFNDNNIPSEFIVEPLGKYACLKTDFAIYAEFLNSRKFSTAVELHYFTKGEDSKTPTRVSTLEYENGIYSYNMHYINDRFQYLSFQVLPRWKIRTNNNDIMYLFAGPSLSYRIGNSSAISAEALGLDNSKFMFGFRTGYGAEVSRLILLELSYSHDFTNAYVITYKDLRINRKHDSFELLIGLNLKKLFSKDTPHLLK